MNGQPSWVLARSLKAAYDHTMEFEWDPDKADRNWHKHGVSFNEAASVFDDPLAMTYGDLDHSEDEDRFITFGYSANGRLLVVSHTDRDDGTRIISARQATRKERNSHENG